MVRSGHLKATDSNLKSGIVRGAGQGSDLYNRYIQKLNKQEDRLESLVEAIDGARARRKKAEDAFADYVSKLKV